MSAQVVVVVSLWLWQTHYACILGYSMTDLRAHKSWVFGCCEDLIRSLELGLVNFCIIEVQVIEIKSDWEGVSGLHKAQSIPSWRASLGDILLVKHGQI